MASVEKLFFSWVPLGEDEDLFREAHGGLCGCESVKCLRTAKKPESDRKKVETRKNQPVGKILSGPRNCLLRPIMPVLLGETVNVRGMLLRMLSRAFRELFGGAVRFSRVTVWWFAIVTSPWNIVSGIKS